MLEENTILNGRYQLLQSVGAGGMAMVYKARDRSLGRIVAVKVLHENLTTDPGFLRKFQREAHAAANLSHPNIVTVHDIGQDDYRHYIVMEYVEGQTLKQIIREQMADGRLLPVNRVLDLSIQLCAGIGYAHRAGLVHCDVKPQNILVTRDERVKVADFGIARAMSHTAPPPAAPESQVWGTPQYFAPEQAAGESPTPASDVYAIGVMLFEMLSGQLPFLAESHTALALKHLHSTPPALSSYNAAVPPQLEQIVAKLLAKEPSGRYRTAGQLGRILSAYRDRSLNETGVFSIEETSNSTRLQPGVPVAEQKTQIYQRPEAASDELDDSTSRRRALPTTVMPAASKPIPVRSDPRAQATDWTAVSLGIFALVALLGLIPLWYIVFRAWVG